MKIRKAIVMVLTVTVIMSMSVIPAFAGSLPFYSGETTAQFAEDNFVRNGDNNWTHDCVVFARMCLEAGGVPRDSSVKSYSSGGYGKYLVNNGYAVKYKVKTDSKGRVLVAGNEGKISPGDLLVNYCLNPNCPKPAFHSSVIYGIEGSYWMQYHHSRSGHPGFGYCQTYGCSKCGAKKSNTICYVYHIKSAQNGYTEYKDKVKGVSAARSSYNTIKVSWKKSSSANMGYNIYYMNHEKPFYRLAATVDSDTTSFKYKVEDPQRYGQDIEFYVVPLKQAGDDDSAEVGLQSKTVSAYTTPSLPTNAKGKRLSSTSVKVTWKKGKGETGCKVEYRYGGSSKWHTAGKTTKTSYVIKDLKANKKVIVRLRPYVKGLGGTKYRDIGRLVGIK